MRGACLAVSDAKGSTGTVDAWPADSPARKPYARGRGDHHTVASEACSHTEVEAVIIDGVGRVKTVKGLPRISAHEHRHGAHAQHVLQVVVLLLVTFLAAQQPTLAALGEALTELDDVVGLIPVNEF